MIDESNYAIAIVRLDEDEGGGYLGFVPDLPGCMSDGETRQEALQNTQEALEEWLEEQISREVEIPLPGSAAADAREREEYLLDAIKSLAAYRDTADEKIAELERQLTELIAVLKDDHGRLPGRFAIPSATRAKTPKLPN